MNRKRIDWQWYFNRGRRGLGALLLALLLGTFLVACTSSAEETVPTPLPEAEEAEADEATAPETDETAAETEIEEDGEPRILRMRIYGDIQNLDPAHRISQNDEVVINAVADGLVRYGPNSYDRMNQLVESIEQSEDGLEVTFKLKEGIQFHRGYGELTTEDVKFSFERFLDPELDAAYADDFATLDHVEIIDKYNGKLVFSEPFAPLWNTTLPIASGAILSKAFVEEVGADALATDLVGTGPYVLADWEPEQRVLLTRNEDYHGEAPYWDEIHLLPISDDTAAEVALEAGELDFGLISVPGIERFTADPDFEVLITPALRYNWIGMNVENPKLEDKRVREAIRYALDVPGMLEAAYAGYAERENALIPPDLVGYWEEAPTYERNVERARELLAEAGAEGLELRIDLEDITRDRLWAEIAAENLKEVGFNVELNPMDSSTYWTSSFGEQSVNNELFTSSYSMQPDPAWATMWFTCDQINVWNAMRWCSEEYDELHMQAMTTMDPDERHDLYIQMQQLWDEAAHTVWLTHGVRPYAYTPDIVPAMTPHGFPQPQWFEPAQ